MASTDHRSIKTKAAITGGACMGCLAELGELPPGTTLTPCARCRRAYYCGRACQQADEPIHATVCAALAAVNAHLLDAGRARVGGAPPVAGIDGGGFEPMSLSVASAAGAVFARALGRPAGVKEREYLLYEPRCYLCHVPAALLPAGALSPCAGCHLMVACGGAHAGAMATGHTGGSTCGLLALVRATERITVVDARADASAVGLAQPHAWLPDAPVGEPWAALPDGWADYFAWRRAPDFIPAFAVAASDLLSVPLTILHALIAALGGAPAVHARSELTVHLAGVSDYELRALFAREELLHLLPRLQTLRLALFSPSGVLPPGPPTVIGEDATCDACMTAGRTAPVLLVGGPDASPLAGGGGAELPPGWAAPDVIVGLNCGIHSSVVEDGHREEWAPLVAAAAAARTPLALTSYTAEEAADDAAALGEMLAGVDGYGIVDGPAVNPWGSARPYADMGYADFYFNSHSMLRAGPTGG